MGGVSAIEPTAGAASHEPRRRIVAIVNPISGRGSALARVRSVAECLERVGASLAVWTTEHRGHGTELAQRAAQEAEAVLTVGGDGTVCEVVNGLARSPVPLTILGMGTENLVAREFHMPTDAPTVARWLTQGVSRACDVGLVQDRCFLAVVGVGFDAECVWRLTRVRRGHITHADYVWPIFRAFFGHRFPRLAIDADGDRVFEGKGLAFVGLIPRYSIGLRICARAKPDDGLLDLCVLPCSTRRELLVHAYRVVRGRHLDHHATIYRQVRHLRIASADRTFVQIDGDCADGPPMECTIRPGGIRLLAAPDDSSCSASDSQRSIDSK